MTDRYQNPVVASVVKSYRLEPTVLTAAEVAGFFTAILRDTATEVDAGGGLVGHIKAVVDFTPGGSLRFSMVKGEPKTNGDNFAAEARPAKVEAAVTAIVFGPSTEELNRILAQALKKRLPKTLIEDLHPASTNANRP